MVNYEEDILKMDFKQLREKVEELDTVIARLKREIESRLTNLDETNFATHINKQRDGMKAEIEITAEKLQSTYTKGEVQSQITQKADEISTTVTDLSNSVTAFETSITQRADSIYATASEASTKAENAYTKASNVEVTAGSINTKVEQVFKSVTRGSGAPVSNTDKTKLYYDTTGDKYYHYDNLNSSWEEVDGKSIFSTFEQTADGFRLTGDVIVGGTITGVDIQTQGGQNGSLVALSHADNALVVKYNDVDVGEVAGSLGAMVIGGSGKKTVATGREWNFGGVTTVDFTGANVTGLTPYLYFS